MFCDHGTKKHPKIYGFCSAEAAASAFDILTCKRALEKGRSVAAVLGSSVVRDWWRLVMAGSAGAGVDAALAATMATAQECVHRHLQPTACAAVMTDSLSALVSQNLGTNHPASNYHNEELLSFLAGVSRDDVIYGLKACAKKGYALSGCVVARMCAGDVGVGEREAV